MQISSMHFNYFNDALTLAVLQYEIEGVLRGECALSWEWEFEDGTPEGWVKIGEGDETIFLNLISYSHSHQDAGKGYTMSSRPEIFKLIQERAAALIRAR